MRPSPDPARLHTERALTQCSDALIGSGQFWSHIVLPDQEPYPTRGRLLVFNGRESGRPALLAHIFTRDPFASSFVIVFSIRKLQKGIYGTELSASLPRTLGDWGYVDRIKLTLRRKYRYRGRLLSYFNAGCPAPEGTSSTTFRLAKAVFSLEHARQVAATVSKVCGVKRCGEGVSA